MVRSAERWLAVRRTLRPVRARARRWRRHPLLHVLGRTSPLSEHFGSERGTPLDRYYIDSFVSAHAGDIRGRALEFQSARYLSRHPNQVTSVDIVDRFGDEGVTIVTDLATDTLIPSETFDCAIVTQVLHYVYDVDAAVRNLHRILKPGGTLLVTVPSVSRIMVDVEPDGANEYNDFWRFTVGSCHRLVGDVFGRENTTVQAYGNVLTSMATLTGLSHEEVSSRRLDRHDPYFPTLIAVRAVRS
jgi:SAM-dependent methyltransferase